MCRSAFQRRLLLRLQLHRSADPPGIAAGAHRHSVDKGLQIGRVALAADYRLNKILVGGVFVPIDSVPHLPQVTPQFGFSLALDAHLRQRDGG
jgi:hypothetical protein